MSVEFKIRDFLYPLSILKLRAFFEKSQWFQEEKLQEYQLERLKLILSHAYQNVPYYRNLFDRLKLKPEDFRNFKDLKKIPVLTREGLRKNFNLLRARNYKKFKPSLYRTSGTFGEPAEFYLDKSSNVLEFCYYWRHFSWAGYRLGAPFAEFSLHHFLEADIKDIAHYSFLTNRLILNPAQISNYNIDKFIKKIKKYRPLFLKGSPSTLHIFSILLEKNGYLDLNLKAVFTTGEKLLPHQRQKMEKVFGCQVLDSYGHMERTIAISQCPSGSYHINSDYGILDIEARNEITDPEGKETGEMVGTSIYNFAMPLIRYKTGDLVEMNSFYENCRCGRGLPTVKNIFGRVQDIVVTPDQRYLTNIYIIFNFIEGVLSYQIHQRSREELFLKIAKAADVSGQSIAEKTRLYFKKIMGDEVNIIIEFSPLENFYNARKQKVVISSLNLNDLT